MTQEKTGIRHLTEKRHMRAAIRTAGENIGTGSETAHGLFVAVGEAMDEELGIEVLSNGHVKHRFQRSFSLLAADCHHIFADEGFVLSQTHRAHKYILHA